MKLLRHSYEPSHNEELFNTISHGVGVLLGVVAVVLLALKASRPGIKGAEGVALMIFGISLT
ncbi:MAG: hypothetical protein ACLFO1_09570, partial [Spirochaetaceae bacterium]